jgi:hypothetical protein
MKEADWTNGLNLYGRRKASVAESKPAKKATEVVQGDLFEENPEHKVDQFGLTADDIADQIAWEEQQEGF